MQITEIINIIILVLQLNTNKNNNIYEYINYFGKVNIDNDIRPLCILDEKTENHFQLLYYNINSNEDLDNK